MSKVYNRYDRFLFLLVASLAAGNFGGSLQLVRLLGILLIPKLIKSLRFASADYLRSPKNIIFFFLCWCAISFAWTLDTKNGIVDFIYFIIHFIIFFEIIVFSVRAAKPHLSISLGWGCAFLFTAIIALWELSTGNHLSTSKWEEGYLSNRGFGEIVIKQFASATFYNYNMYELFICFCIPFIMYLCLTANKSKHTFSSFILIVLAIIIAIINASRGALITLLIMLTIGMYGLFKKKKVNSSLLIVLILVSGVFIFVNKELIFDNLIYRLSVTDMLDGQSRFNVWRRALGLFSNNYGLGTGIGGMAKGMMTVSTMDDVIAPHNMLLEILLVHGIFVFLIFVGCLIKMFSKVLKIKHSNIIKIVTLSALISFPVYSIINSTYLQNASLYIFFASIYVFLYNSPNGFNYNNYKN